MKIIHKQKTSPRGISMVLCFMICFAPLLQATEYSVKGFISQGYVVSNNTNVHNSDSENTFDLSQAGLNIGVQFNPKWQVSGQLLYLNKGDHIDEGLRVDYLNTTYMFNQQGTQNSGIRIGRIKPEIGIYNSTRDIPWTKPSIFMPKSIYPDAMIDGYSSYDAIGLFHNMYLDNGQLEFNFLRGKPNFNSDTIDTFIGENSNSSLDNKVTNTYSIKWLYDYSWLFMLTSLEHKVETAPHGDIEHIEGVTASFIRLKNNIASIQYTNMDWEFTAEYQARDSYFHGAIPLFITQHPELEDVIPAVDVDAEMFYLQGKYNVNEHFSITIRSDFTYNNIDDRHGDDYEKNTRMIASVLNQYGYADASSQPSESSYAKSVMLGTQWQPSSNWLISAEGHFGEGVAWSPPYYTMAKREFENKYWSIYAVEVAYRF